MNRKRILLAVLAGLFALSVIYAFWATPRQEQAPPRPTASRPAAKGLAGAKAGQPPADRLNLGLLAELPQPFPGAGRDIFRIRGGAAAVIEEPADDVTDEPEAEPAPPPPPPPTPEQLLQAKVAGFTFLGFLEKGGVKTVFLAGSGELFLVKAGDAFGKDKSLLAREINAQELVVGSTTGPETVRVKLIENEALEPMLLSPGARPGVRTMPTGFRTGGGLIPARRSVLTPRAAGRPPAPPVDEEDVQEDVQPPDDGVEQEEPPDEEAPATEGDGDAK